jgi:TRAP-type C4-dicarboxylate transport system permease small subunit
MTNALRALDRAIGFLCALGAAVAGALLLVCLALVSYSVAMRYFLGHPTPWVDEVVGYLLIGLVMAAAADALRRGEHIGVDVLAARLGPRGLKAVAALGQAAALLTGLALLVGGVEAVAFTQMLGIRSTGWLATPMHWPMMLVPFGGGLLALAAAAGLLRMALGLAATTEEGGRHGAPEDAA